MGGELERCDDLMSLDKYECSVTKQVDYEECMRCDLPDYVFLLVIENCEEHHLCRQLVKNGILIEQAHQDRKDNLYFFTKRQFCLFQFQINTICFDFLNLILFSSVWRLQIFFIIFLVLGLMMLSSHIFKSNWNTKSSDIHRKNVNEDIKSKK